jgi:hypothetical protein
MLVVNVLLGLAKKTNDKSLKSLETSINVVDEGFLKTLNDYGILEEWIKKRKISAAKNDSVEYKYMVNLPIEVTIPEFLKDLNINLKDLPVNIRSEEKRINEYTILNIISNDKNKLFAEFRYKSDYSRPFSEISFLLTGLEDANSEEIERISLLAYPFGALLPLSEKSQEQAEIIKNKNYEYFIEILKEADKVEFELNDELNLEIITKNVRNIISSFNSPKIFFIDGSKKEFNSSTSSFLTEQFGKRDRTLMDIGSTNILKGENLEDLKSLFNFHLNNIDIGDWKIFLIDYRDWIAINEEINEYAKKGNKIVNPSKLFLQ